MEMILGIFMTFCADSTYPASCKYDLQDCVKTNYEELVCIEEDKDSCTFQYCYESYFTRYFSRK